MSHYLWEFVKTGVIFALFVGGFFTAGALFIPWAILAYWEMLSYTWLRNMSIFAGLFGMVSSLSGGGGVGCFIGVFAIVMILGLSIIVIPLRFLWSLICLVIKVISWIWEVLAGMLKGGVKGVGKACSGTGKLIRKATSKEEPCVSKFENLKKLPLPETPPIIPVQSVSPSIIETPSQGNQEVAKKEDNLKKEKMRETVIELALQGDIGMEKFVPSSGFSIVGRARYMRMHSQGAMADNRQFTLHSSNNGGVWELVPSGSALNTLLVNKVSAHGGIILNAGDEISLLPEGESDVMKSIATLRVLKRNVVRTKMED